MSDIVTDALPDDRPASLDEYRTSSAWSGLDWLGMTKFAGQEIHTDIAQHGLTSEDMLGNPVALQPPEPKVDPETLNQQYGIDGQLKFTDPLPESVAKAQYDAKREELFRADAAERTRGFWPNVGRFSASLVAGALDPVNIAASFVPGVGEARMASVLGMDAAAGIGSRLAIRAATGATQGVAGQAALEPLQFARASSLQEDHSAVDVLSDLAFGAALGGGLHATLGAAGDALSGKFRDSPAGQAAASDVDTHAAALNTAVAQQVEGRPVEVGPVLDAATTRQSLLSTTAMFPHATDIADILSEPTVEAQARKLDPDTFAAYDQHAGDVADRRQQIATAEQTFGAPIDAQINDLRSRALEAPVAERRALQEQANDLASTRDQRVADAVAQARQALMAADQGMRDLAPKVSAATRGAEAIQSAAARSKVTVIGPTMDQALKFARGEPHPDDLAVMRAADRASREPPPDIGKEIADAQSQAHVAAVAPKPQRQSMLDQLSNGRAAPEPVEVGAPAEPHAAEPEMIAANQRMADAEGFARAYERLAGCGVMK